MGAIGSREVRRDLAQRNHQVVELERGSLDAKIWKDVKRKRVRIPDLLCTCCGQRIEARAKSEPRISMSHSPTIAERRWDYGMVATDWIALPICKEQPGIEERADHWTRGMLVGDLSYWNEKEWVHWLPEGAVNYFSVDAFRNVPPDKTERKGAEEGSETILTWRSCFSPAAGTVQSITESFITVRPPDGPPKRAGCKHMRLHVGVGEVVQQNQIIACNANPLPNAALTCRRDLTERGIVEMLTATQLPVRFSGVKLARLNNTRTVEAAIRRIAADADEDIYVRLEASAYLCAVHNDDVAGAFAEAMAARDKPDQLEAVIAIGEVGNAAAANILAEILGDARRDYFLRSAAAYCLGRLGSFQVARTALVRAFEAQSHRVREDALAALADAGFGAVADLLAGLARSNSADIQAGCAEVVRWLAHRSDPEIVANHLVPGVARALQAEDRTALSVWLGGQLPADIMRPALSAVLESDSRLAYALSVAWAFAQSWIAPLHDGFNPPVAR